MSTRKRSDAPAEAASLFAFTDTAQAERFVDRHGDRLCYDHQTKRWHVLDDQGIWGPDRDGEVIRAAIDCARELEVEALSIADDDDRHDAMTFARRQQQAYGIQQMLRIARNLPPIANVGGLWNLNLWLLGVANGVVDLRTGQLRPGRPEDRISFRCRPPYDPNAQAAPWRGFVREIFDDDVELIGHVHRATGYSISGSTREQRFNLLYGDGANGKTTFLETLAYTFGDYADTIPSAETELSRRSSIGEHLAKLPGKRFVTTSESVEQRRLNEAWLKAVTGGEAITCRGLYRDPFTYHPQFHLWFATNHKPRVLDDSHGFWRRALLVPFKRRFDGKDRDERLGETLRAEAAGILAWAVEGCLLWQQDGLKVPESVVAATEDYRIDSDPLAEFLAECCERVEGAVCRAAEAYKAYLSWAADQALGERYRLDPTSFGRRMSDRFTRVRSSRGNVYTGLRLTGGRRAAGV